jgi:hypothetical protein
VCLALFSVSAGVNSKAHVPESSAIGVGWVAGGVAKATRMPRGWQLRALPSLDNVGSTLEMGPMSDRHARLGSRLALFAGNPSREFAPFIFTDSTPSN